MAGKAPRRRSLAPSRYPVQVVIMMSIEDGQVLKDDAASLGVAQAELARRAIRCGYRDAKAALDRERANASLASAE